jgi:hypothetical protein
MFGIGLLLLAIWLGLKVSGALSISVTESVAWVGVGVLLAGILVTATRPGSVLLEVAGDA